MRTVWARLAAIPVAGWYSTPPEIADMLAEADRGVSPVVEAEPVRRPDPAARMRAPDIRWTTLSAVRRASV